MISDRGHLQDALPFLMLTITGRPAEAYWFPCKTSLLASPQWQEWAGGIFQWKPSSIGKCPPPILPPFAFTGRLFSAYVPAILEEDAFCPPSLLQGDWERRLAMETVFQWRCPISWSLSQCSLPFRSFSLPPWWLFLAL